MALTQPTPPTSPTSLRDVDYTNNQVISKGKAAFVTILASGGVTIACAVGAAQSASMVSIVALGVLAGAGLAATGSAVGSWSDAFIPEKAKDEARRVGSLYHKKTSQLADIFTYFHTFKVIYPYVFMAIFVFTVQQVAQAVLQGFLQGLTDRVHSNVSERRAFAR